MEINVDVTYRWKISDKQWADLKAWLENDKFTQQVNYDNVDMWYHLNQTGRPDTIKVETKELKNETNN